MLYDDRSGLLWVAGGGPPATASDRVRRTATGEELFQTTTPARALPQRRRRHARRRLRHRLGRRGRSWSCPLRPRAAARRRTATSSLTAHRRLRPAARLRPRTASACCPAATWSPSAAACSTPSTRRPAPPTRRGPGRAADRRRRPRAARHGRCTSCAATAATRSVVLRLSGDGGSAGTGGGRRARPADHDFDVPTTAALVAGDALRRQRPVHDARGAHRGRPRRRQLARRR